MHGLKKAKEMHGDKERKLIGHLRDALADVRCVKFHGGLCVIDDAMTLT